MFRRRWLAVIVVLVLWGLATHSTYAGSGDEPHYLAITHSLGLDLDLDVSNNYGPGEPLIGGGALEPEHHTRAGRNNILRPVHDVGMPFLFAPLPRALVPVVSRLVATTPETTMRRFRLTPTTLYRHCLSAAMALVAAWLAVLMFGAFREQGLASPAAFRWALLVALSPPLLVMSILFFTEVLSAVLCFVVFRFVHGAAATRGFSVARDDSTHAQWLGAGVLTGLLLLVHIRNAGLVAGLLGLAAHAVWRRRSWTLGAAFTTGVLTLFAIRTFVNYRFWGTFVTSPHARVGDWTGAGQLATEMGRRVAGLLLDQEFGLLPYAPVFLLVPVGLVLLASSNRRLFWSVLLVAGLYLFAVVFPITNAHGWTGGWSPAARFLVPIVPMLALAMIAGARAIPRALLIALVVIQIGLDAYFWQNPKNVWNDGDGVAAVCSRSGATFCRYLPSFVNTSERQRP